MFHSEYFRCYYFYDVFSNEVIGKYHYFYEFKYLKNTWYLFSSFEVNFVNRSLSFIVYRLVEHLTVDLQLILSQKVYTSLQHFDSSNMGCLKIKFIWSLIIFLFNNMAIWQNIRSWKYWLLETPLECCSCFSITRFLSHGKPFFIESPVFQ